ncbi:MAG: 50S ribosomal protein L19e [Thermoprotei archaeon]|nr:MAG: 50S ribosomal protein L19e [Thermoprotei archaeon]
MDLSLQKRLAAEILGVGESRVWIDPEAYDRVEAAITKEDIRKLIKDGIIRAKPEHSNSRARWRIRHEKRKKGRRRGPGHRKGGKYSKVSRKEQWMMKVRALRKELRKFKERGVITPKEYRKIYRLIKGGVFDSVAQLRNYIRELVEERM